MGYQLNEAGVLPDGRGFFAGLRTTRVSRAKCPADPRPVQTRAARRREAVEGVLENPPHERLDQRSRRSPRKRPASPFPPARGRPSAPRAPSGPASAAGGFSAPRTPPTAQLGAGANGIEGNHQVPSLRPSVRAGSIRAQAHSRTAWSVPRRGAALIIPCANCRRPLDPLRERVGPFEARKPREVPIRRAQGAPCSIAIAASAASMTKEHKAWPSCTRLRKISQCRSLGSATPDGRLGEPGGYCGRSLRGRKRTLEHARIGGDP